MKNKDAIGKWAFIIGLAIAIIAAILQQADVYNLPQLTLILVVLGLIVGFLNISEKDSTKLLIAIIALLGVGGMTVVAIPAIDAYLTAILKNFVAFVAAAGFVVAVKSIYEISKK